MDVDGAADMKKHWYVYQWGNNDKRRRYKGRRCQILKSGSMGSVLVRFEDGEKTLTSRRALRPWREGPARLFEP